jgi:hypothetical protein
MASYSTPTQALPRQLTLDLDLDDVGAPDPKPSVQRSVIFPKKFQKRVSALFDPLHINIEFRLTRHNRLEMRWSFPDEAVQYNQVTDRAGRGLSPEENKAFETLVLSFAGASH